MTGFDAHAHWEKVYTEKDPTQVSWYQSDPARSLALLREFAVPAKSGAPLRVVDAGAGASLLVDRLLDADETRGPAARSGVEIAAIDVAPAALARLRERIAAHPRGQGAPDAASRVRWIEADLSKPLQGLPDHWADAWHDRAVFHFLTSAEDRAGYAANLRRVLRPGGVALISGFAPDGPTRCSGLEVRRHDGATIAAELPGVHLVREERELHRTPWGAEQRFVYAVLRRDP